MYNNFIVLYAFFFFKSFYFQNMFSKGIWKEKLASSQLKTLLLKLRSTILSSKAKRIVSKYANGFNRFWLWAKKYSEISSVLPASELHVSLYLQFLIDSCKHYSSVESAFYSIKWAHNLANLENPCNYDFVRSIVEASKRLLNMPILKKKPVDAYVIKSLFNHLSFPRSLTDLRLSTLCSLSYTGFLRYDELSSIRARNLLFHSEYLDIVN